MKKLKLIALLGTLWLLPLSSHASHGFAYGNWSYATVNGFVQTPQGGSPGTTSFNRPSFDELNIHRNKFYFAGVGINYCDYFGLLDYHHFSPHSRTILSQALITHGKFIPAGSAFDMKLEFDMYSFGLGKHFRINDWVISPLLAGNWLKYHYDFQAPPFGSARTFTLLGADVGARVERHFTPKFSGAVQGAISIPLSNIKLSTIDFDLTYRIKGTSYFTMIPRIAAGFLRLDYEDEQTVPNHIRYTANAYVTIGLAAVFN